MTWRLIRLPVALTGLALAGCGDSKPPPPPPPPTLELKVSGSADQNPGADNTPGPVSIHVYDLAGTGTFNKADVFALTDYEQATLGADDLGSSDFVLKPSETQTLKRELKPGTQAIGVLALFYDIDNARWGASAAVAPHGPTNLVLTVDRLSVSLKAAGP
jgi:type VI secretion system protein VasD